MTSSAEAAAGGNYRLAFDAAWLGVTSTTGSGYEATDLLREEQEKRSSQTS